MAVCTQCGSVFYMDDNGLFDHTCKPEDVPKKPEVRV